MNTDTQEDEEKKGPHWTWFLFSFKGRVTRKQFWIFNLIIFSAGLMLGVLTGTPEEFGEFTRSQIMFMLWIFWPSLAVQAKRWHDINKSAWWLLLNAIPIAGPIWALIENGFLPGTPGDNKFGPPPLEPSSQ